MSVYGFTNEEILRAVANMRHPLSEVRTVRRRAPPLTYVRSVEILEGIVARIRRSLRRLLTFDDSEDGEGDWRHINHYISDEFTEFNRINDRLEKENYDINENQFDIVRRHSIVQDEAVELYDQWRWRQDSFRRIQMHRNVRRRLS